MFYKTLSLLPWGQDYENHFFRSWTNFKNEGKLLPDVIETLSAISELSDSKGAIPILSLICDYHKANSPAEAETLSDQYYELIKNLGIKVSLSRGNKYQFLSNSKQYEKNINYYGFCSILSGILALSGV